MEWLYSDYSEPTSPPYTYGPSLQVENSPYLPQPVPWPPFNMKEQPIYKPA